MRIPEICPLPAGSTVWGVLRDSGGAGQDRSIDQQRDVLRAYCAKHQLILQEIFADAARTGDSTEHRDALNRMLDLARSTFPPIHDLKKRNQRADEIRHGIVFWNFARLGRDSVESAVIRNDLRMRGLKVISLSDDILTGNPALDQILEAVLDLNNEMQLGIISRDVKRGIHSAVSKRDTDPEFLRHNPDWKATGRYLGIFPGPTAPRGYQFEQITTNTRRDGRLRIVQRLIPNPDEWQRALIAWRMRVEDRATCQQIHEATHLYSSIAGYASMFKNRIYTGTLELGDSVYGTPDDPFVEPLIPEEWFEIEQKRRAARAARRKLGGSAQPGDIDPRHHGNGYLLSGLLVCARCGARLHGETMRAGIISTTGQMRKEWPFYYCSAAKKKQCSAGRINGKRLEKAVIAKLHREIIGKDRLRIHADRLLENVGTHRRTLSEDIDALEALIATARRESSNVLDAIAQRPSSTALLGRLDEIEARLKTAQRDLQVKQAELAYWSGFEIDDAQLDLIARRINAHLLSGDRHRARLAISTFVSKIEIDSGKKIHMKLYYIFPHPDFLDGSMSGLPLRPGEMTIRRKDKNWYKDKNGKGGSSK